MTIGTVDIRPIAIESSLKSGWNRSLQDDREWFGLLQPSQFPLVAAPVLAVGVAVSSRDFEFLDLSVVFEDAMGRVHHAVGFSCQSLPRVHDACNHLTQPSSNHGGEVQLELDIVAQQGLT